MKLDRFIHRPVLSSVISILIIILGLLGLILLPVERFPDIAPPTISVSTSYTGADASTILNSVVIPLEDAINGVENMNYITGNASNDGNARINIVFKQGTDPDMAAVNVQNRVQRAINLLPAEVVRVGVQTNKRNQNMLVMFTVYSPDNRYDETFVENYIKINILPRVLRVKGVGEASAWGRHDYSVRIWLKPDIMAQYKLMPNDITAALNAQNIDAAPGKFGENSRQSFQYILRYKGRLATPEEYENIIIRSLPTGEKLYLKDVARIELGALNYNIISSGMGHPGASVAIYQMPGTNATEVIKEVLEVMEDAAADFPEGLAYTPLQNSNDFLFASINKVLRTLLEAFILVFIVVYIFLQDFRSTIIPAVAVPVAIIGTFFFLYLFGFSINLLTLFALVLAIAIVVDDAIVVVEAVHAKLDEGYTSARQATIDAMNEISGAIVSITLVMAAVFIPVTFIGGTAGIFYTQFGITLAVAIVLSAVNALTLSPALCALFLKGGISENGVDGVVAGSDAANGSTAAKPRKRRNAFLLFEKRFRMAFNVAFRITLDKYKGAVQIFVRKPALSIGLVVLAIIGLFFFLEKTPKGLIPNEDNGFVYLNVTLPPATTLSYTNEVMNRIDSIVGTMPLVAARTKISGSGFATGNGSCYGNMFIQLKDWKERTDEGQDLESFRRDLQKALSSISEAQLMIFSPPMIPGFGISSGFEINLQDKTGGDLLQFYDVAQKFMSDLVMQPEIEFARTAFNPNFPQYEVLVDVEKCALAGTSPADVLQVMQGYFGGMYVSNFNRFGKLYRVMIQGDPAATLNTEALNNVYVRTSGNSNSSATTMSPISQFVNVSRVYGPENINHFNLYTSINIKGEPAMGYSSGDAIAAIQRVAGSSLPVGYGYEFSGATRNEQEAGNSVGYVLALCLVFVYLLLCIQYESYILPLAVILSLPFGLCGSFIFARAMGLNNNIYLQISLIMLIGLLAKNAVLIVQFALARRQAGIGLIEAAKAGAAARLRPILMTSFALIVGLLPLMFSTGVGSNGNQTIGAGAVGGMFTGMIFQLLIVPVLFVIFERLQEKVKPLAASYQSNSN
ncbi:MAG: efflux RND transporter permease subunit [Bacteroidales bacterium]|jgi:HAE1 family hydrophobic/amphiphilic exporter-1|nr:efflux RND transporter permease subunit [Bacteroidales bacterium]